jgi:hypothetical protein
MTNNDPPKEDVEEDTDKEDEVKMSFLDPYTISWMNKRRPGTIAGTRAQALITPSRALQLREIFRGLDFDGSGEISLDEMQEALKYVGETDPSMDVDSICRFFVEMDTDGNGSIDYGEFVAGMSSDTGTMGPEQSAKMQEAFFNFANKHQRQQLIDTINDKSMEDQDRYKGFMKLFEFSSLQDRTPGSIEEELEQAKKDAVKDKQEMGIEHWNRRRAEFTRSRRAQLSFEIDKSRTNRESRFNRLIKNSDIVGGKVGEGKLDPEIFTSKAHNTLKSRMGKYRLNSACTYTPPLSSVRSMPLMKLESMVMSQNMMKNQVIRKHLPPMNVRSIASRKMTVRDNRDRRRTLRHTNTSS